MEKFIGMVKARPYLYDCNNVDFKNRDKKMEGWEEIAKKMGSQNGSYWRFKWNRLKENYSKYKKINGYQPNPIYRKYRNWPWAECMKFTDGFPTRRSMKKVPKSEGTEYSVSIDDHAYVSNELTDSENNITHLEQNENVEQSEYSEDAPEFLNITRSDGNLIQNEIYVLEHQSNEENELPAENIKVIIQKDDTDFSKKRKMKTEVGINEDNSYNLLKSKKTKTSNYDEAEHFFLSYAKTYKRLPLRLQRVVKLEMVTLFARYELMAENSEAN